MNKLFLLGNFTRDPEIKYAQGSNTAIARFSLAVSRRFKREGEPEADFFNCTAFGKTAEFIEKYMHKGSKAALVGRVENDNYTNKNGEKVYSVKVLVDEIEFAERKQQDGGNANPTTNDDDDFVQVDMNTVGDLPFFAKENN